MLSGSFIWLLACTGAEDTGTGKAETTTFACELGVPTEAGWQPLASTLEMEMGFQGFVLAQLQLKVADDAPSPLTATMVVEPEGTDAVSGSQPLVYVNGGITDPILVFFTSNYISYYLDRSARVAVRVSAENASCAVEGAAILVDEDPCMHTGDEPICPDDSGYISDSGEP
ncbi:MAG: hypothetical protein FJ102_00815 [Deltaproteobacteria bacterium]|nr:hypothetical protein [Deltaproteobacteria bacterium]